MKIGAHVSSAGGILKAFENSMAIGANCFQIFVSSPRMWKVPHIEDAVAKEFKEKLTSLQMLPSFIHIKYLVNFASPNDEVAYRSLETAKAEYRICQQLGLTGGMFHIGAPKGTDKDIGTKKVITAVKEIISDTSNVSVLLENSASPNKLGSTLEEIAQLLEDINHPRATVCLDTAHALAAGYDLRTEESVEKFIAEVDRIIGLDCIELFHVNDSKSNFHSGRDLHENIGEGKLGNRCFATLLNHPKLRGKPFIIEVPGYDNKGPDKHNIDTLKQLIS